tara:strand:- start:2034 stop:3002 length:969 start_codon:yes stop_codon:yes gene_type:complete
MSTKKVISINPAFFKLNKHGSGKKDRRKKKDKSKRDSILSNSVNKSLKKDLLNKIKEHQNKKKTDHEKQKIIDESNTETDNNLKDSINFLNNIAKKRKEKQEKKMMKRNKTLKNNTIHKEPKYGCLKNGTLPTYKQYNKTLKQDNNHNTISNKKPPISFADTPVHTESFEQRQNKLNNIKAKFNNKTTPIISNTTLPFPNTDNTNNNILINNIPQISQEKKEKKKRKRKMKTLKRKITLGKKNNIIGVLIKNKKTRKNIKREVKNLEKKSITNIKKYLRKHNLIKIGSTAPDDVLRKIYENSYLAGDIYNKNPEMLIHNFLR